MGVGVSFKIIFKLITRQVYNLFQSSHGGLEVEQWIDNSTLSISVGSNLAWRQKDFCSNSNTTGGALNLKGNPL